MPPTVTIVTPTRHSRLPFFRLLARCVQEQDYKHIKEWVVVGGDSDNSALKADIGNVFKVTKGLPPLVWVDGASNTNIGALRNASNDAATCDIIVPMDDDDYYPPTRVSHVVSMFQQHSDKLVAGCTRHYMYDYETDTFVQWRGFGPNHGTNNTIAYKREYALKNRYDDSKKMAEEPTFLKNFTEPMVQLNPDKTVVQLAHSGNTFSKRRHMLSYIMNGDEKNPLKFTPKAKKVFPKGVLKRYCEICPMGDVYDIVYYLGTGQPPWHPTDTQLGGSEQAVLHLSELWASQGLSVGVFGDWETKFVHNDVVYESWTRFNIRAPHKNVILWRLCGCLVLKFKLGAKNVVIDLHDINWESSFGKLLPQVHCIATKSEFHKKAIAQVAHKKGVAIPNGLRDVFLKQTANPPARQRFRFVYASSYKRGLEMILQQLFPGIRSFIPEAELHVFYGMHDIDDEAQKANLTKLLDQPGVFEYGRLDVDEVIKQKQMSDFHLYISGTLAETDCITIRESAALGCIPITANVNVFAERPGLRVNMPLHIDALCTTIKNDETIDSLREGCMADDSLFNWETVAKKWNAILI